MGGGGVGRVVWAGIVGLVGVTGVAAQTPTREDVDRIFAFPGDGPGCAAAVVIDGRLVHRGGYGLANVEFGVPITPTTVFDFASTSKQFTAATVFSLAHDGSLDLAASVREYLPELVHLDPAVTVRHLIHHTSGIRGYFGLWSFSGRHIDDAMPRRTILELLARQKALNFRPGAEELYSNSNYFLLAEIVSRVTGSSFGDVARERVFRPAGMETAVVYDDVTLLVDQRADGYQEVRDGVGRKVLRSTIVGDGGVYGSIDDLAAWAVQFDRGGTRGVGPELLEALVEPGRLDDGTPQRYAGGLRWSTYRGLPTLEHGGTMGGYRSYFRRFPERRFTAIVLCNLLELSPNQLTARLADLYLGEQMDPRDGPVPEPYLRSEPQPPPTSSEAAPGVVLNDYVGEYRSDELLDGSTVRVDGDLLLVRVALTEPTGVVHVEGDTFRTTGGLRVVFTRDDRGRVNAMRFLPGRVREIELQRVR